MREAAARKLKKLAHGRAIRRNADRLHGKSFRAELSHSALSSQNSQIPALKHRLHVSLPDLRLEMSAGQAANIAAW